MGRLPAHTQVPHPHLASQGHFTPLPSHMPTMCRPPPPPPPPPWPPLCLGHPWCPEHFMMTPFLPPLPCHTLFRTSTSPHPTSPHRACAAGHAGAPGPATHTSPPPLCARAAPWPARGRPRPRAAAAPPPPPPALAAGCRVQRVGTRRDAAGQGGGEAGWQGCKLVGRCGEAGLAGGNMGVGPGGWRVMATGSGEG